MLCSLFILITAEGWTDVMKSLKNGGENFGIYFFIISFLFIGHFIFGNLFVAVVIEQIDRGMSKIIGCFFELNFCHLTRHHIQ